MSTLHLNSDSMTENDQISFIKIMALSNKSSEDIQDLLQKALGSKAWKKTKIETMIRQLKKEESVEEPAKETARTRQTRATSKKTNTIEEEPPKPAGTRTSKAKAPPRQAKTSRAKKVTIAEPGMYLSCERVTFFPFFSISNIQYNYLNINLLVPIHRSR